MLGSQDKAFSLPLETRKLRLSAHLEFLVGASEASWEGKGTPTSSCQFSSISYYAGWRLLWHAVKKAYSGTHRQTQLGLKPRGPQSQCTHLHFILSPPGPLAQGLGQVASGAGQTLLTTHTVEGAQGGPAQGAAVLETRNCPKGPGRGPYPLSPISATLLPPLLNGTLRPGCQASSTSPSMGPKRSSGSRHGFGCPPGNEAGTICPAHSWIEARGSQEVTSHFLS